MPSTVSAVVLDVVQTCCVQTRRTPAATQAELQPAVTQRVSG